MKKYLTLCLGLATIPALIFICGCTKKSNPPIACVTTSTDTAGVHQNINFSSCTAGAIAFLWNFGDGTTANTANATHSYSAPGTYTATLTATGPDGTSAPKSKTIVIGSGGTYSYNGKNYIPYTCYTYQGTPGSTVIAIDSSAIGYSEVNVDFAGAIPTTNGVYNVVRNNPQAANEVMISLVAVQYSLSSGVYLSIDNAGQVTVTVTAGRISISGTGITLEDAQNSAIHLPLNMSIKQWP